MPRSRHGSSRYVNTFGRAMYPLVMRAYRDHARGAIDRRLSSRRWSTCSRCCCVAPWSACATIGSSHGCAARAKAGRRAWPARSRRITPSDERVRVALKYGELPHAAYVLGRLAGVDPERRSRASSTSSRWPRATAGAATGSAEWADYTRRRAEQPPRAGADARQSGPARGAAGGARAGRVVPREADAVYARSEIASTRELVDVGRWGTAAIAGRTVALTARFLRIWARPATRRDRRRRSHADPRCAAPPRMAAAAGSGSSSTSSTAASTGRCTTSSTSSTACSSGCGRTRARTWSRSAPAAAARSSRRRPGTASGTSSTTSQFLYMGWDSKYMLTAVQGVLEEAGLAPEVFVKYSYIGAAM